ncbi:MAG: M1 family metallopeptidase [Bacteroidota bacterium]|jgi:leukotriene A-4 hydrolase/aminopeptidase
MMRLFSLHVLLFLAASTRTNAYVSDPHSAAKPDEAVVIHLNLDLVIDFSLQKIIGTATWEIKKSAHAKQIHFDANGLLIREITDQSGQKLYYELKPRNEYLGDDLSIDLPESVKRITIRYETGKNAYALQWVTPQQTSGKQLPFLYTQSQSIAARTWLPCQDSPGIRYTYDATVTVPKEMLVVMSAENPTQKNPSGTYKFRMRQSIPAYLMALAAGDLVFEAVGKRTGIYAEPSTIKSAVYEFADMEKMLLTAEKLFGPYRWGRYDVLVMPPSFPFGGMENPRITFATPTVIAGDRSLVSLIAHELAHSWSGNLVTNATWNDFWLNEGFTVYLERRIVAELYGQAFMEMEAYLGLNDLKETISELGPNHPDSQLKLRLDGRNPEDAMTDVAYEKGFNLLTRLRLQVGNKKFDRFLEKYFNHFAFQSIVTEQFILFMNDQLLNKYDIGHMRSEVDHWIYAPDLPKDYELFYAEPPFKKVDEAVIQLLTGDNLNRLNTKNWSTYEWVHFINRLDTTPLLIRIPEIDNVFKLTQSGNCEIQSAWYELAAKYQYKEAYGNMENFLLRVGRRKYLRPIYKQLAQTPSGKELAIRIFNEARDNYHPVSQRAIEEILKP